MSLQAESQDNRLRILIDVFKQQFGHAPELVVRAPGRVNLIGEHTDYNEGFVFPAAIDREMTIVASTHSNGDSIQIYSHDFDESESFSLSRLESSRDKTWMNYLKGVLDVLTKKGHKIKPFRAVLSGTVPQGSGLSSSAAYEVAVATLENAMSNLQIDGKEIALLAQSAENEFIGVQCGIMDQFVSSLAQADCALLVDCRSLEFRPVPLNLADHGLSIVITHSGVRRGLVDSQYNKRRDECRAGVEKLSQLLGKSLKSLRDVTPSDLERFQSSLDPLVLKRCRHVVTENDRVLKAVNALEGGDLQSFGQLMNESHLSLKDDYEVSCPELDTLVQLTQKHEGVLGARMTGAGFGGCTVAVMKESSVPSFKASVVPEYEKQSGKQSEVHVCSAARGAEATWLTVPAHQS